MAPEPSSGPIVILGAGYAGLTLAQEVARRSRGRLRTVLVDRNPVHVLRTELYEIGRLARAGDATAAWTVPLAQVFERTTVECRQGVVRGIDLTTHTVHLDTGALDFGSLAVCLGNVPAYYGVPGAAESTHSVYRLSAARALARSIVEVETASGERPGERRPRIAVVGGGSTGTELAAEIASTDWSAITGVSARPPDVFLLTGSLPFLAGFPPGLVDRARRRLRQWGVSIVPGLNVVRVEPHRVELEDGTVLATDLTVWCAGLEAPTLLRELPVPHGKGGRVVVDPTLEVKGHPGLFAVGDVAEIRDPETGAIVPATAQAAVAEARVAGANLVARSRGSPLTAFRYADRGTVLALGIGQGAASLGHLNLWGSPAAVLKRIVQREYSRSVARGERSGIL